MKQISQYLDPYQAMAVEIAAQIEATLEPSTSEDDEDEAPSLSRDVANMFTITQWEGIWQPDMPGHNWATFDQRQLNISLSRLSQIVTRWAAHDPVFAKAVPPCWHRHPRVIEILYGLAQTYRRIPFGGDKKSDPHQWTVFNETYNHAVSGLGDYTPTQTCRKTGIHQDQTQPDWNLWNQAWMDAHPGEILTFSWTWPTPPTLDQLDIPDPDATPNEN
jgi:hypothetical protein